MFFARMAIALVALLPAQGRISRIVRLMLNYDDCRKKVIKWHRTELEKLDHVFQLQQASFKLLVAREKAHAQGIGPSDPGYPNLFDVHQVSELKR